MLSLGVVGSLAGSMIIVEEGVLLPFFLSLLQLRDLDLSGPDGKLALPFGIANPFEGRTKELILWRMDCHH